MFHGRISLKSVLLLLLVNFVSGFRLEMMFISLMENIRSSLTHLHIIFSCLCCCHSSLKSLFHLYQKDKSSGSKVKLRQASNFCKRVFEATRVAYANKTRYFITSQKLGSRDFWQIANSVLNKGKSAIPPLFNGQRCCLLHLIKQNCLLKTFLKTPILMTQVSLYLFSLLELI